MFLSFYNTDTLTSNLLDVTFDAKRSKKKQSENMVSKKRDRKKLKGAKRRKKIKKTSLSIISIIFRLKQIPYNHYKNS